MARAREMTKDSNTHVRLFIPIVDPKEMLEGIAQGVKSFTLGTAEYHPSALIFHLMVICSKIAVHKY